MMRRIVFLISFFQVITFQLQAQIQHVVAKGETVFQIAKKYEVTPYDIYRLNPDAKEALKENTTLLIPKPSTGKAIVHEVGEKETLYGIAKKYNVTVSDLEQWNKSALEGGLKKGQQIFVSKPSSTQKKSLSTIVSDTKPKIATKTALSEYEVQPKETLYSLTKKFNISQEDLIKLNPDLLEGVKIGMILNVPSIPNVNVKVKDSVLAPKNKTNLLASVDFTEQKSMVLLLPFNINKMETDSLKTRSEHLKTNKFLNLTLDFYAGALMAIDSAKVLGLPVDIKVYDVESSKNSSNVATILSKNNFEDVDVVIGPFQNATVETTAQLLTKYNVPVISPLSKERGFPMDNLYYAVPSEDLVKASMFQYFKSKNGNVVAIISAKKVTSKEFITKNYPTVKHAAFNDKGALDVALLKTQLVKGQKNFVLLEIEKASTILNITKILKGLQKEYDIQLVVLELYDALNFEEIPMKNLTDLKLLFPSATKVAETPEEKIFELQFKKINNIYPNAAAKKGFDITFDAMLRICQPEGFAKSAVSTKTEYIENAFDYSSNNGMITNNATYLLYYDSDLTIKQAQ